MRYDSERLEIVQRKGQDSGFNDSLSYPKIFSKGFHFRVIKGFSCERSTLYHIMQLTLHHTILSFNDPV